MANTKKTGPQDKETSKKTTASKAPQKKAAAEKAEVAPSKDLKSQDKTNNRKSTATPRVPLIEKTHFVKHGTAGKQWKLVDASGLTLGRLASQVAVLLMGKHYANYTPNNDTGDSVIVINAEKVRMTGDKWNQKVYQHHTNFPGGLKTITAKEMLANHPERIVEKAVWRMMPKSRGHMARHWFSKLHVYAGPQHPHQAQKPEAITLAYSTQGR
ncbi:MAG: 50S ribosomal protein L13 [Proteobacteria bacterium]|nr:50S ribosomal protein L13 [Pseudomonadota bacterium]NDC25876.1 50S ribosomal protein L13 [Pseudomonadota bacterium]NDD04806.1 50S ribosomal protein L13 [Pseudomonadota bacterium]NDG27949.1 50S ribosomal protein L13 [Pseudomonadota bacterium]